MRSGQDSNLQPAPYAWCCSTYLELPAAFMRRLPIALVTHRTVARRMVDPMFYAQLSGRRALFTTFLACIIASLVQSIKTVS